MIHDDDDDDDDNDNTNEHSYREFSGSGTPAKRRRLDFSDDSADEECQPTPRPAPGRPGQLSSTWQRPETSSTSSAASTRSTASSPRKKMVFLSLLSEGVERRSLEYGTRGLPLALGMLLKDIDTAALGYNVISKDRMGEIRDQASMEPFPDFVFSEPGKRDTLGVTPALAEVLDILNEAKWCFETGQAEHGWNCAVHYRLMRLALHGSRRQEQLVDCTPCATARIIKEYLPASTDSKLVDFAIYLRPSFSDVASDRTEAAEALRNLRSAAPELSANHTDMEPLKEGPITVSVETKRSGDGADKAELQIGTWQAAQWKMLAQQTERVGGSLQGLPFLPCLIIHGHDWNFAATSREGTKTVLWVQRPLGNTKSILGIYKVLYSLQLLLRWSRDEFWPWYKADVLGLAVT
ncbi:hypothetical protein NKR23_g12358 [Pleurostoma richardsiae]|uniref:PD-(D/E)XK nuclease-like domain-containing protein n=1 Tax=Pleurostoma richardsiae TaxID=41990 RepID=A0AA38VAX7_9PEZI|nr:hypothetical protein NKR23_g12358 [Pleurostoma richardsiae]